MEYTTWIYTAWLWVWKNLVPLLGLAGFLLSLYNWKQARSKHQLDTHKPHLLNAIDEARARVKTLEGFDRSLEIRAEKIKVGNNKFFNTRAISSDWVDIAKPTTPFPAHHKQMLREINIAVVEAHSGNRDKLLAIIAEGRERIQKAITEECIGIQDREAKIEDIDKANKI